jgi:hypothetical protein
MSDDVRRSLRRLQILADASRVLVWICIGFLIGCALQVDVKGVKTLGG